MINGRPFCNRHGPGTCPKRETRSEALFSRMSRIGYNGNALLETRAVRGIMVNPDQKTLQQMKKNTRFLPAFLPSLKWTESQPISQRSHWLSNLFIRLLGEACPIKGGAASGQIRWLYFPRESRLGMDRRRQKGTLRLSGKNEIVVYRFGLMYKRLVKGSLDQITPRTEQIDAAYHGN